MFHQTLERCFVWFLWGHFKAVSFLLAEMVSGGEVFCMVRHWRGVLYGFFLPLVVINEDVLEK